MPNRTISHFKLQDLLGEGAMGRVYRAVDLNLDRPVAIKLLADRTLGDPSFLDRFKREARLAAQLNHPNIATIYAFGEEKGEAYLAMELVQGITLSGRIKHGVLSLEDTRKFGAQIARALDAAHAAGIIHRDIKTSNLMITPGGDIKVMDFGVSRRMGDTQLTMEGSIVGTANIMAPEVVRGQEATPSADLFSLGCVLYEALSGRPAFAGEDPMAVLYLVMNEESPPLTEFRPDVPPDLLEVVNGLLIKDPAKRLGPARKVAEMLSGTPRPTTGPQGPAGTAIQTMVLPGTEIPETPLRPATPAPAPAVPVRGRFGARFGAKPLRWAGMGLIVAIAIVGGWLVLSQGDGGARARAQSLTEQGEQLVASNAPGAERLFLEATQADPGYAPAWNNLGFVYQERGEMAEARDHFITAAKLDPQFALALVNLADLQKTTDPQESEKLIREALSHNPENPRVYVTAAGILDGLDRDGEAMGAYREAIRLSFEDLTPWNNLGSMLLEAGKGDSALAVLDEGLAKFSEDPRAHALWRNKGNALLELERYDEADSSFSHSLDLAPEGDFKAMALRGKARLAETREDRQEAARLWQRVLEEASASSLKQEAQAALTSLNNN